MAGEAKKKLIEVGKKIVDDILKKKNPLVITISNVEVMYV